MSAADRPRVALVTNALGLGGTEKLLQSCALAARDSCDVHVIGVERLGPRGDMLLAAGVEVADAGGDEARLAQLLEGTDVVHVVRHGAAEPRVPAAVRRAGVPHMVETNIFGHVDESHDRAAFDAHLFLSKFCLLRYRNRLGAERIGPDFDARHKVLSAPIEYPELRAAAPATPQEARALLGLDPDRPTVGRVGRADDMKWRRMVVDMVPELLRLLPDAQVLFVGLTPALRRRLDHLGVRDRVADVEPSGDPARLSAFYRACDVFVAAAQIGESQGIANGEALAMGVPVVTCSTPWADNAQVEFVEHGVSGWYASHPRPFAEATADLLGDDARRAAFGAAGAAAMERDLPPDALSARVGGLYRALAAGRGVPEDWTPTVGDVADFAADYARRAHLEFRPLTARERAEARAERLRERAVVARSGLTTMLKMTGRLRKG